MKKILFSVILAFACQCALAQSLSTSMLPGDARSLSLGGIRTADKVEGIDVRASFGTWAPSSVNSTVFDLNLAYGKADIFAAGLELTNFKGRQYNITDESGCVSSTYSPSDIYFGAFGHLRVNGRFTAGARVRCAVSDIGDNSSAFAIIGVFKGTYNYCGLDAGISFQAGSPVNYGNGYYSTPLVFKAEASYSLKALTTMCELGYEAVSRSVLGAVGAEYSLNEYLTARAGYHFGKVIPSFFSLGLGVSYRGLGLSAAYLLPGNNIGNSFLITVSCCL